jgi:hypothetical protein
LNRFFVSIAFFVITVASQGQHILFSEDFEQSYGTTPPSGWSTELINGSVSLDSFEFSNDIYFLSPPITSRYALFDSYKGGQLIGTNGNGQGEEVALISPWILDLPSGAVYLQFDYHFVRYSKAEFHVDIRTSTGGWSSLWDTDQSTTFSKSQAINLSNYSSSDSMQLRFRWKSGPESKV